MWREIQPATTKESLNMFRAASVLVLASTMVMGAHASALTPPAEQAGEMLARIQAVDTKCNYLGVSDKDTLSRLVARSGSPRSRGWIHFFAFAKSESSLRSYAW